MLCSALATYTLLQDPKSKKTWGHYQLSMLTFFWGLRRASYKTTPEPPEFLCVTTIRFNLWPSPLWIYKKTTKPVSTLFWLTTSWYSHGYSTLQAHSILSKRLLHRLWWLRSICFFMALGICQLNPITISDYFWPCLKIWRIVIFFWTTKMNFQADVLESNYPQWIGRLIWIIVDFLHISYRDLGVFFLKPLRSWS